MIQGKCEAEGKDNSKGHGVGVDKGKVRVQEGNSKGQYKGEVGGGVVVRRRLKDKSEGKGKGKAEA